jgi:glycosyltransferase involved in cell wall biosynthesis
VTAGFYCPLPPARTGVAEYGHALLGELRRHGRVEVCPETCDVALYHLGNNPLHGAIYRRSLNEPGVVVLHDLSLHHFLLGALSSEEYIEEVAYNLGEWSRSLARELWNNRASSAADPRYFEIPLLKRALETARAVVVHNPEAKRIVLRQMPEARVIEIPHLYAPPVHASPEAEILRYRRGIGVASDDFLFGVFGYLRESKRLISILEAFSAVRAENGRATLLVAGDFVSSDLERAAEPLLRSPGVIRRPFLSEGDFQLALAATDACINLRSPAAGETSGIAIRMMGLGKAVFLTDSPEYERFPEDGCIRIPAGAAERESLRRHMVLLTSVAAVARGVGRRAAHYVGERHRLEKSGSQYWNLLCEFCSSPSSARRD